MACSYGILNCAEFGLSLKSQGQLTPAWGELHFSMHAQWTLQVFMYPADHYIKPTLNPEKGSAFIWIVEHPPTPAIQPRARCPEVPMRNSSRQIGTQQLGSAFIPKVLTPTQEIQPGEISLVEGPSEILSPAHPHQPPRWCSRFCCQCDKKHIGEMRTSTCIPISWIIR